MRINPIMEKDLKTKLRGWRSMVLILCYVLFLMLILLFYFAGSNVFSPNKNFSPRMAVDGYNLLITFQFALLFLAVPAITATSISSERERQTLDLMLVTSTPARKIILGKIMVSIAHTMLLVAASLPVIGVVFFFGGIGFLDIAKLMLFYVITAFFVASSGVFFSTLFRRNIVAIIVNYVFLGLITFGPFISYAISTAVRMQLTAGGFNPGYRDFALALFPSSVFGYVSFYFSGTSGYNVYSSYYGGMGVISSVTQEIEQLIAMETGFWKYLQPWMINGAFSILSAFLLIFLASVVLNPVRRKK